MGKYPDKKQIAKKTEDFVRTLRNYVSGNATAPMVKNEFQCLFTDLALEEINRTGADTEKMHFPDLIKEW